MSLYLCHPRAVIGYPSRFRAREPASTVDRAYERLAVVASTSAPEADQPRGLASAQCRRGHLLARDVVGLHRRVAWTHGEIGRPPGARRMLRAPDPLPVAPQM